MPEIDPATPPLSSDELADDAAALGTERDAPPLTEAQDATQTGAERIESDLTLLPPG